MKRPTADQQLKGEIITNLLTPLEFLTNLLESCTVLECWIIAQEAPSALSYYLSLMVGLVSESSSIVSKSMS
jgi:hypothetical protein